MNVQSFSFVNLAQYFEDIRHEYAKTCGFHLKKIRSKALLCVHNRTGLGTCTYVVLHGNHVLALSR